MDILSKYLFKEAIMRTATFAAQALDVDTLVRVMSSPTQDPGCRPDLDQISITVKLSNGNTVLGQWYDGEEQLDLVSNDTFFSNEAEVRTQAERLLENLGEASVLIGFRYRGELVKIIFAKGI